MYTLATTLLTDFKKKSPIFMAKMEKKNTSDA